MNDEDFLLEDHSCIEEVFINFYSNLWHELVPNSFANIVQALPHDLNTITSADWHSLTRGIIKD